jgi:TolA-binding protein
MSIIADTLKRLQAGSTPRASDVPEEPSLRPTFNQGEGAGRHLKASGMKFWIIGVGMTVGLAGLALSAFWIGLQIDFGLSTNTHARMDNSRLLLTTPLPSEIQVTTQESSGTVASATPEISHSPLTFQAKEENATQSSIVSIDTLSTQGISHTQTPIQSRLVVFPPELSILSESSDQHANSTSEQSVDKDRRQITPGESSSREPHALEKLVHHPTPEVESQHIIEVEIKEPEESQIPHPETVTLEGKSVHTEELLKTAELSTNPIPTASSLTALKGRREVMDSTDQMPIPLQPSSANRLRHARQLIQSGHYEEAVVLLSPLFHDPPVKWQPWFWMGTALLGQKDLEQADQFFLSGLARNDKIPQLWIQRALVAQQRGNYRLAIHELRQAESLQADLPHIHLNMGYAYEHLGNDRLANQYYGKFLKLSESNPAFFATRKKLFARVTQQAKPERPLPPSVSSSLNP